MITIIQIMLHLITFTLIRFIYKAIWIPFHVQRMMKAQGITGPSYRIVHGTTKESTILREEALKGPMELSHDIFPKIQPQFYQWMKLYGKNFLTWAGPQPHVVITEPEIAKEILTNKEGIFLKPKSRGNVKKLLGDGLVMAEGAKWFKLRKLANHAFYAESLKEMIPSMIASVETMLQKWRQYQGREMDVCEELKVMSSEVIARTAFGSSYLEGKNIFDMLTKLGFLLFKNMDKIRPFGMIWKTRDDVESDEIEQSLRDTAMSIVRKREERVVAGEAEDYGTDFLGALLKAHHDSDKKSRISIDDVIDECKVFFLAGHETTSSLLSWTIFLLAIHTDWQEKARQEVLELFGEQNPTAEGLPRLKTASMIMNETLRLYSPVASLVRRGTRRVRIGRYEFPAKMEFHIPTLALHRNQEIWGKDVHLFKPERFAEGVATATRNNPMAFLPFGYGPRTCVGLNFATNEAKIALSMILQRYSFTLSKNYAHFPINIITTRPQCGVQIILQPLQQ
ncbi:cytochrome P450 CYP749A22-like [Salvia miltiorrhiza]|uniref:cytochrome P450 CYP749A22-like n=1 Tax=Salvia miltiorrhiza TaxID=226208 RepID=UPI0025AD3EB4|nr:cytochrome P450 CYP749A22-like [Salvia miltiorrhiza]